MSLHPANSEGRMLDVGQRVGDVGQDTECWPPDTGRWTFGHRMLDMGSGQWTVDLDNGHKTVNTEQGSTDVGH